jgi:D-glycero-alpha-D-manno-heptose-7-phosphate kinase
LRSAIDNQAARAEIAETACGISSLLGIVGGKQDEYGAALGGMHLFSFGASVTAEKLTLGADARRELLGRLILVYSGRSRLSSTIHEDVWGRYKAKDASVVSALRGLKAAAGAMKATLLAGDINDFATLLEENWRYQRALAPSITNPDLDSLFDFAHRHGALGGKACGAGGGGCVVFVCKEGQQEQLKTSLSHARLQLIDVEFDQYGVVIEKG